MRDTPAAARTTALLALCTGALVALMVHEEPSPNLPRCRSTRNSHPHPAGPPPCHKHKLHHRQQDATHSNITTTTPQSPPRAHTPGRAPLPGHAPDHSARPRHPLRPARSGTNMNTCIRTHHALHIPPTQKGRPRDTNLLTSPCPQTTPSRAPSAAQLSASAAPNRACRRTLAADRTTHHATPWAWWRGGEAAAAAEGRRAASASCMRRPRPGSGSTRSAAAAGGGASCAVPSAMLCFCYVL